LTLREPKSGREHEVVFIPQKVAGRLREYATKRCQTSEDRIFPISYETARMMVAKAGKMVGVPLRTGAPGGRCAALLSWVLFS
jgi:integrase/recombinase XerD